MGEDLVISGFFDVVGSQQSSAADKTSFGLGQAELDLSNQLADNISAYVGIAYNNEARDFNVRTATFQINLFENENSFFKWGAVSAGQFDVPFGIDWNYYSSIDRKLVTPPLAVDYTHGEWNDFGVQFKLNWQQGNFVVYGVNGFESSFEVSDAAQALSLGLNIGDEVNTTPANAFGTRLGFNPTPDLELGGSFATGLNASGKNEMLLYGIDAQWTYSDFAFKGEYIEHKLNRSIEEEKNKGYYFQTTYSWDKYFLCGRYGAFQPNGNDWVDRYTFGAGWAFSDAVQMRFETTLNNNSQNNTNIVQLVGGF